MTSKKPVILIIDDSPETLRYLISLLKTQNFNLMSLVESQQLEKLLEESVPDLILLDLYMPDPDGIGVLRFLKNHPAYQNIPVIMLTSEDEKEMLANCLEEGAVDYLTKPVSSLELKARVNTALRLKKQYDEIVSLKNKLNEQLEKVGEIQQQLLPQQLPESPDYRIEVFYEPCEASGGDYYDVFTIGNHYTGFLIADISGHGAPAMVTTTLVRGYLKLMENVEISPAQALTTLNETLWSTFPTRQYLTIFYSLYDHRTRKLIYASAGHPAPWIWDPKTETVSELPMKPNLPMKLVRSPDPFYENEITLKKGQQIFLYTDGYLEAFNETGQLLGKPGMREIVKQSAVQESPTRYMMSELNKFSGKRKREDDIALVWVRFNYDHD